MNRKSRKPFRIRTLVSGTFAFALLPLLVGYFGPDSFARSVPLAIVSTGALKGLLTQHIRDVDEDDGPYLAYEQALNALKKEYFGDSLGSERIHELTIASIRGMLRSLNDPYTSYLDNDEWSNMQQTTRGDFDGIGAELEQVGPLIRVRKPLRNTPAWKAGVKMGDIITKVTVFARDGSVERAVIVRGHKLGEIVSLVKGHPGTKVGLTIQRVGSPNELFLTMVRAHVEPEVATWWMEDKVNHIGHIVLSEFNEMSDDQMDKALSALEKQGMRALVLDLRYNPGGLLEVAVDIGSRFIERGPVVIIQEKSGQQQQKFVRTGQHNHRRVPMVVLVNEHSASAAEIVAGAIKDNGTATIVGKHTFGKGMVQTLFPLTDGSALRLTTARYFTSAGNDISNRSDEDHRPIFGTGGIKPDVEITQSDAWPEQDFDDKVHDVQLAKALELLRQKVAAR